MPPLHLLAWIGSLLLVGSAGVAEARALLQTVDAVETVEAEPGDPAGERHEHPMRMAAYHLYLKIYPPCPIVAAGDDDAITAPARAAFADFQREVAATPYRSQFEAGVADAQHWLTVIDVLCRPSTTETPDAATHRLLAETQQAITSMRALMRP